LHTAGDIGRSYLRVFSDSSFDLLASYQLGSQEIPTAITSMAFGSGSTADKPEGAAAAAAAGAAGGIGSSSEESPAYYIVGTAVIKPNVSVGYLQHVMPWMTFCGCKLWLLACADKVFFQAPCASNSKLLIQYICCSLIAAVLLC
jgi:hypothetical protein